MRSNGGGDAKKQLVAEVCLGGDSSKVSGRRVVATESILCHSRSHGDSSSAVERSCTACSAKIGTQRHLILVAAW